MASENNYANYRNTDDNYQVTISKTLTDKIVESGICYGFDPRHPYGLRLMGKFEHLQKVLDMLDDPLCYTEIELVPKIK